MRIFPMTLDLSAPLKTLRDLANATLAHLPQFVFAVIVFAAFYFASRVLRRWIRAFATRQQTHESAGIVLGRLAQVILVGVGLFVSVTIVVPSVHANSLIELLGVTSIGIGFAFKDILQNFLAGILILLNQPFKLHDQIVIGNFEGTVEDIQTRATFIKTYDGRRVVIPNSVVFTEAVTVNTAFEHRRSEVMVGIGYGDDIAAARALIVEAIKSVKGVIADPAPDAVVQEIGGSSINIRARWWSQPTQVAIVEVRDGVVAAIKQRLTDGGVDLPFPTQQLLLHDQTEETDGDRAHQREGWPAGKGPSPRPARAVQRASRDGHGPRSTPAPETVAPRQAASDTSE
jgi:small conductance mechanosensitive channel